MASSPLNSSLTSPMNKVALLSSTNTTLRQVDYDEDVTPLYEAIGNSEWDKAASLINNVDAATWVVRYERDAQGNRNASNRIQWRFLPIHSACALNPPASFLRKLVSAYSDGPRTLDDQGLLPLHYACGARCSRETIYSLLMNFPQAALKEDPNGMLPMHYLAQWGPDGKQGQMNMGVLDMVLVSTGDKAANCDRDGNTAERLAMNAEYDGHLDVAKHIASFLHRKGLGSGADPAKSGSSISSTVEVIKSPKYKNNRPVLKINVASPRSGQFNFHSPFNGATEDEETVIEHAPDGNIETSLSMSMSGRENRSRNNTPRSLVDVQKQVPQSPISTPKSGRIRAFSWDDYGHNNNNNENNNARDNLSLSGSTWTTHLSTPPKTAPHAVHRQMRPQAAFPPMSPRQAPPMSPRQFPPMSPRVQTGRVSTPKGKVARPQQTTPTQAETRQDDESGRVGAQSLQSGSTNSTNYSSQLTQQLVEMAEMERREGFESPRANRASFASKKNETSSSDAILLEEIARLKAEKERAETDLANARGSDPGVMFGSFMGASELSTIGEDEMSRLTTDDHVLEQPIGVPSKDIRVAEMVVSPVGSEIARLEKERELIDIQLKKAREGPIDPEEKSDEEVKDDYKLLFEKEQNEHDSTKSMLEEEKRKHAEEQNEHISTKNMLEEERRKHGEDMQSHLEELKSLRESLERATDEIAKHQSHKTEMQELKKKELDWDVAREQLVAEIKRLQEKESSAVRNDGGIDNSSVTSTLTNNSGLDNSVLKMQYESSVKEANDLRKFSASMRKEHDETISELEAELKRERNEKIEVMSNVVSLEYRISTLEDELEEARSNKSKSKFNSEHVAELEANLENESSKRFMLQQKVCTLEKDLEEALSHKKYDGDIDRMAFELHQLKRKLSDKLEEAEKSKDSLDAAKKEFERKEKKLKEQLDEMLEESEKSQDLLDTAKRDFERKEKKLLEQLDEAQEQLIATVKQKHQDTGDADESYLQKIRNLKRRIRELEEEDDLKSAKVREAEKVKLRTIQEKEDECIEKIRQLKKQYEQKLEDKEDEYFQEVRELKKKQEMDLTEKEESYLRDLRDAKKKQDEMQDEMMKKIQDENIKLEMMKKIQNEKMKLMQDDNMTMQDEETNDSSSEIDVNKLIEEKENAFKERENALIEEVAKLTEEIDTLRHESKLSESKLSESDKLDAQLLDCKSDLKSQGRKHRSEINKLKNTLEMQKSKEVRLEGHIKTLEKQIMSMTADYEERIQEYLYGNIDTE